MTPWKIGSVRGPGQQVHFEEPENVEPVTVMVKVEAKPLATTSYCPLTSELQVALDLSWRDRIRDDRSRLALLHFLELRARHAAVSGAAELTDEILHHGDTLVFCVTDQARAASSATVGAAAIGGGEATGAPAA